MKKITALLALVAVLALAVTAGAAPHHPYKPKPGVHDYVAAGGQSGGTMEVTATTLIIRGGEGAVRYEMEWNDTDEHWFDPNDPAQRCLTPQTSTGTPYGQPDGEYHIYRHDGSNDPDAGPTSEAGTTDRHPQ